MNVPSSSSTNYQSICTAKRLLLATIASAVILASGCAVPTKGPTDPKEFMVQRRQWTSTDSNAASSTTPTDTPPPSSTAPTSPDASLAPTPIN